MTDFRLSISAIKASLENTKKISAKMKKAKLLVKLNPQMNVYRCRARVQATIENWAVVKWPNKHPLLAYKFNKLISTLLFLLVSVLANLHAQKKRSRNELLLCWRCQSTPQLVPVKVNQIKLEMKNRGKQKKLNKEIW